MKPLVTALIDTYDHERYIEQALVSVIEQGLSPAELEIVVVDDGSTDKTPSIIQKFAPRVKNVRKNNGGQASAFNTGFAQAHGELVAFLDGDDWWAAKKLAKVIMPWRVISMQRPSATDTTNFTRRPMRRGFVFRQNDHL